ncbi:ECF-type sigma factor [Tahibacter caeni]|uniref:ECF-type sigma factor n=1 Tax=Tahibacter caeni TaxID=1453545 RepID=UPI0021485C27|nr:ECF-type sigma factor [Tahibacter caeni]
MLATSDITALLAQARNGDERAVDRLLPQVYERLRQLAHRYLAGGGHQTLSTTALVHEAYLSLVNQRDAVWQDRAHFLGYAATAMRHILIDHARRKSAQKRGGGQFALDWHSADIPVECIAGEMVALDAALAALGALDQRLAKVVELRFFAGLSVEEVAAVLGITTRSVVRDWNKARLFLHHALETTA